MAWTSARVAATDAGAPARPAVPVGAVPDPGDAATTEAAVAEPAATRLGAPEGSPATTRDPPGSSDSSPRPSALLLSAAIGIPFSAATVFSNSVFSTIVVIISPDLHVCVGADASSARPSAARLTSLMLFFPLSLSSSLPIYTSDVRVGADASSARPSTARLTSLKHRTDVLQQSQNITSTSINLYIDIYLCITQTCPSRSPATPVLVPRPPPPGASPPPRGSAR